MTKNNLLHFIVALVFIILLLLLIDPLMIWMPSATQMGVLLLAVLSSGVWAGLVIGERGGDEREKTHRMNAGRAGYLSGMAILTVALLVQGLSQSIDIWIIVALLAMIIAKLVVRIYTDKFQ